MMLLATIALALAMPNAPVKKVLVIGVDGCRPDALTKASTPYIDSLIRNGCWAVGKADPLTLSGPCWSTVLCGVWAPKHGVTDNSFVGANTKEYPDFLTLIERSRPSLRTVAVAEWKPVLDKIVQKADYEGSRSGEGDEATALEAATQITDFDPDVVFVHFGAVDTAGHAFGFGASVPQYLRAIEETDKNVGLLLAAVQSRKKSLDENWLVILTSDHGGSGTSHGQAIPEHMNVPFIVSGSSSSDGFDVIPTLVDVAPTVFAHLGLVRAYEVDWDGVPVGLKGIDSIVLARQRDSSIVTFSPTDGFLLGLQEVGLRAEDTELVVRFTVDGSLPTDTSLSATSFVLEKGALVRARAFKDREPVGPSSFALFTVQGDYFAAVTPAQLNRGLACTVLEGRYSSTKEITFSADKVSRVSARPTEIVGWGATEFAARFEGYFKVEEDGVFQFGLYCDDGAVLTIDDRVVVDHDGMHAASMKKGLTALRSGYHKIRLVYFQNGGDARLNLAMGPRGEAMVEMPYSMFWH